MDIQRYYRLIFKAFFAVFLVVSDPFGLGEATSEQTQSFFSRLSAPYYSRSGQDHVSAIVITDDAAERQGGYPLSFRDHAAVVRRLLCLDPAGLFIDLNFRTARNDPEGVEALAHALTYRAGPEGCDAQTVEQLRDEKSAPVLLAVVRNDEAACRSLLDAGKPGCEPMAPLKKLADVARLVDVTHLVDGHHRYSLVNPGDDGRPAVSPAVQLALSVCRKTADAGPFCAVDANELQKPMFLRWGYYLSPGAVERHRLSGCRATSSRDATATERFGDALKILGRDSAHGLMGQSLGGAPIQPCPYTDQATIAAVLSPEVNSDPTLAALIKDRAVIYGADVTALPDKFVSPVHGSVAGLFVHAMATDNLLTLGTSYWRDPPHFLVTGLEALLAVLALCLGHWAKQSGSWRRVLAVTGGVVAGAVVFSLLWSVLFHFAPLNFILVSIISAVDSLVDGPETSSSRGVS